MSKQTSRFYEFGRFHLDPDERQLSRDGQVVQLAPKIIDTLVALVEQRGRIVSKGDLMQKVWQEAFVEEGNLAVNISQLRKTLGQCEDGQAYIETIPKRGYRFSAQVREVWAEPADLVVKEYTRSSITINEIESEEDPYDVAALNGPPNRAIAGGSQSLLSEEVLGRTASSGEYVINKIWRHKRGATAVLAGVFLVIAALTYVVYLSGGNKIIDSIAVLPLVNVSADPNTEYLSDGISESIINSLSQFPNLKVMSRNSVFRYKGREADTQAVGRELGVRSVLTGRVEQRSDGLFISVELVDAQDNRQIWGQQYNRKLADIFAVQEEIAREIFETLRLKLPGAERQQLAKRPTDNLRAFQYYMQGRWYAQRRTREDLLTAIRYCEKAIEEDRNFALAYAGLADAYVNLGVRAYIAPIEGRRKAEEAARKALVLDENLAEAHFAISQAYVLFAPYDLSLADRELRRAIELSPSLAVARQYLGISLAQQGRFDESLEKYVQARELDPLSSTIARNAAFPYYLKRDYARALDLLRQADDLGPAFSSPWEIGAYIQNGLFDEALVELEKAKRERKSDPALIHSSGMVYAAQGKRAEALQIIKELEEMSGTSLSQAHYIAKIYAALNEKEPALTWLDRGLAEGAIGAFYKGEPVWDSLRGDPRFGDLLGRMGVPQ
ncbi:MAG TPA: winged helix-turn-helix domain-containing protein [Blastocatellia bacterium]|nr:winged helix-turn-helix domain-containing protein [Blastocatellia bacterium]